MEGRREDFEMLVRTAEQLDGKRVLLMQNAADVLLIQQKMEQEQREKEKVNT